MPANTHKHHKQFDSVSISIASPDQILSWSHGEVTKPETINYRTQKPERDGLFCERIFGPTKNYECACGKYKKVIYRGVICEKCGVEVTRSSVRRERMGHIDLAVPVTHIWFLRSTPSRIGLILDLPIKSIEQVVYFAAYIILEVDEKAKEEALEQLTEEFKTYTKRVKSEYKKKSQALKGEGKSQAKLDKLAEDESRRLDELNESYTKAKDEIKSLQSNKVISELEYRELSMKFGHVFRAGIGAEAIRQILEGIDLKKFIETRYEELTNATEQRRKKIIKRIKLVASLRRAGIRPEWMVMTKLPVLPPDLRPMVQLDGGRYAASDLNDLYRRVINRNNRLKKLIKLGAPEVICRNEKRMLQEAVDTLLNNSARSGKAVFTTSDRRKLRSLSDMLKGKQGRFRQNLLGKRVDYSGRSVIVVGPELKLHQCGIPKEMALKLFKPFVIGQLIQRGLAHNVKNAERVIQSSKKEVWDILEEVTRDNYVLLNRAPTLHRLSIQAFQLKLIEGKAIQLHPLVCAAFNADFDGDQMAVHVPLSRTAQKEAHEIMASNINLLKPSAGEPITTATQDMVMGCFFLTCTHDGKLGEGMIFPDFKSVRWALENNNVHLQAKIKVRYESEIIETSPGRVVFNEEVVLPAGLEYKNYCFDKKQLKNLIAECFNRESIETTAKLSDAIKDIGFKYATLSGVTISADDMIIPSNRDKIMEEAEEKVKRVNDFYWKGWITAYERYIHNIRIWSRTKNDISKNMIDTFEKHPENDIRYQIVSGARGNWGQITQLCGMKGLVANPSGKTIELPIRSNLKEGFTILEYFIATHGGRKGKSDTALKTAEAGYLTRRLVDAVHDLIIRQDDCGSESEYLITRKGSDEIGESFEHRIFGRTLAKEVRHPKTGKIIAKRNEIIDYDLLKVLATAELEEVSVRPIMQCLTENGICQKCYGLDLGTNKLVELGTAVGIIAAQSIGEPGTQLTMRTFHMGGVAESGDITQGLPRVEELFEARPPKHAAILSDVTGTVTLKQTKIHTFITVTGDEIMEDVYAFPASMKASVKKGDKVKERQIIARSVVDKAVLRAKVSGKVKEIKKNNIVVRHDSIIEKEYKVSSKDNVVVENKQHVKIGDPLTAGHYDLRELMAKTDVANVQKYIMSEVQSIYASQGQTINDKHIEIIVKQMFSKVRVIDTGDGGFLPGEVVDVIKFEQAARDLGKKKKALPFGERILLGLTRIALYTPSWLSAASFQETIRVLVEASTTRSIDRLDGLKENVIIGRLINAGETYRRQKAGKKK
jgi:DNA-directed RNA polymerase subunit beta'